MTSVVSGQRLGLGLCSHAKMRFLIPALFPSVDTWDMVSIFSSQVGDGQCPKSSGSPGANHIEG